MFLINYLTLDCDFLPLLFIKQQAAAATTTITCPFWYNTSDGICFCRCCCCFSLLLPFSSSSTLSHLCSFNENLVSSSPIDFHLIFPGNFPVFPFEQFCNSHLLVSLLFLLTRFTACFGEQEIVAFPFYGIPWLFVNSGNSVIYMAKPDTIYQQQHRQHETVVTLIYWLVVRHVSRRLWWNKCILYHVSWDVL